MSAYEQAIRSAVKANGQMTRYFNRMGNSDHPGGFVMAYYRNALRGMKQALQERDKITTAMSIMDQLAASIEAEMRPMLKDAQAFGSEEAVRQLSAYGVPRATSLSESAPLISAMSERERALEVVLEKVKAQKVTVQALILTGVEDALIVGDVDRMGVLRPGDVLVTAAFWLALLAWNAWTTKAYGSTLNGEPFKKQSIAALDGKTTDCCLRAHGQIQPLDRPFVLTGTPRFADKVDFPPFHHYCRTAPVLYLDAFDDGLTVRMREAAKILLDERARGIVRERYPVDAYL